MAVFCIQNTEKTLKKIVSESCKAHEDMLYYKRKEEIDIQTSGVLMGSSWDGCQPRGSLQTLQKGCGGLLKISFDILRSNRSD